MESYFLGYVFLKTTSRRWMEGLRLLWKAEEAQPFGGGENGPEAWSQG